MPRDEFYHDAFLSAVYDAWHPRHVRDDYDFYLPLILQADRVLDVGCGTGTLLQEARAAGHRGRLVGIDPAPGVIGRARAVPGVEWVLGTLQQQGWDQCFDLIVMTGHAFQAIVDDSELARFLASVRKALVPGGTFVFETRNPAARAWQRWESDPARVTLPEGGEVAIGTIIDEPFDGRTITFRHLFTGIDDRLPLESRSTLRFLGADELVDRLEAASLSPRKTFGDFDGTPLGPESSEIIMFAAR